MKSFVRITLNASCMGLFVLSLHGVCDSAARAEGNAVFRMEDSWYAQSQKATEAYIHNRIRPCLEEMNQVDRKLGAPTKNLTARLDVWERQEGRLLEQVRKLIEFHKLHNSLLDKWAGGKESQRLFLAPMKVDVKQVKKLRSNFPRWPKHPPLWIVGACRQGLSDHAIPCEGLLLDYQEWLKDPNTDDEAKMSAFFFFLRKACTANKSEASFLEGETGAQTVWNVPGMPVRFSRWRHPNYYEYHFIPAGRNPLGPYHPLRAAAAAHCLSPTPLFDEAFYKSKVLLFADLVREMSRKPSVAVGAKPYLAYYSFFGRSFPCLSAFQFEPDEVGNYRFIKKYADDKPAIERSFDGSSPVGMAYNLVLRLSGTSSSEDLARHTQDLLSPILLLQFQLRTSKEDGGESFPYEDLRVGYKGYLDFYKELVDSNPASNTRTPNPGGGVR